MNAAAEMTRNEVKVGQTINVESLSEYTAEVLYVSRNGSRAVVRGLARNIEIVALFNDGAEMLIAYGPMADVERVSGECEERSRFSR